MPSTRWRSAPTAALLSLLLLSGCAAGDRVLDRAGRAAERAVGRQVDDRANRAVDGAFDVGENAVRCAFGDDACAERARQRGEDVVFVDRDGRAVDAQGRPTGGPVPGAGADTGFDFAPGARTLFEDDFESTRTGNVPGSVRFVKGEVDVVDDRGDKVLRVQRGSVFAVPMGERPGLFTVEFEAYMEPNAALCITTTPIDDYPRMDRMRTCGQAVAWTDMTALQIAPGTGPLPQKTAFVAPDGSRSGTGEYGGYPALSERYVPVRATVDGTYLKVYLDDVRVVNVPNVELAPGSDLVFFVQEYSGSYGEETVYIDDLRVGAGGQETGYAALATGGRVTATGVRFESGSAQLTGSSQAELGQILAAMRADPGLRIRVEGHTDSAGGADGNQRLSQRRAQAVADWLTGRGVAASRVEAVGMGEDRPVASNDTAAGRERNRRVEIVGL